MPPVPLPADSRLVPGAVAVEPPDLRPIAVARGAAGLTGGRLTVLRVLFALVAVAGLVGFVASFATGYLIVDEDTGQLLEARRVGDGVSATWAAGGLLLGLLGVALAPRRRTSRWVALGLFVLASTMLAAVFLTIDLHFNLDWDTRTIDLWPKDALPASIVVLLLAGPVLLAAEFILVRLERRRRA